jgi:hypothetical protein
MNIRLATNGTFVFRFSESAVWAPPPPTKVNEHERNWNNRI